MCGKAMAQHESGRHRQMCVMGRSPQGGSRTRDACVNQSPPGGWLPEGLAVCSCLSLAARISRAGCLGQLLVHQVEGSRGMFQGECGRTGRKEAFSERSFDGKVSQTRNRPEDAKNVQSRKSALKAGFILPTLSSLWRNYARLQLPKTKLLRTVLGIPMPSLVVVDCRFKVESPS